jgi:hypothetical protein
MHLDPTAVALLALAAGALLALPWRENDVQASVRALRSLASMLQPFTASIRMLPEVDLLPAPLQAVRLVVPTRRIPLGGTHRKMAV